MNQLYIRLQGVVQNIQDNTLGNTNVKYLA